MNTKRCTLLGVLLLVLTIHAGEIVLKNSNSYNGCEDGYLSAIFKTSALLIKVADSQTNHFTEPEIYVSK